MGIIDESVQKQAEKIYRELKKKHYRDKEPWEKFIDNDRKRSSQKRQKISQNELITSDDYYLSTSRKTTKKNTSYNKEE